MSVLPPNGETPSDMKMLLALLDSKFETQRALADVSNAKLDNLAKQLAEISVRYDARFTDHEGRILTLESHRSSLDAERGLQVPIFKKLIDRVDEIEEWSGSVKVGTKISRMIVVAVWTVAGGGLLAVAEHLLHFIK